MVEILPIPKIPEQLVAASKAGRLIPFVGAGTSMLAGCPGWNDFANAALSFFIKNGKLHLGQFEQLKHLSPRIKLSIAKSLAEKYQTPIDYEKILDSTGTADYGVGQKLYGHLSALSKTFVTTNYDGWLDRQYPNPHLGGGGPIKESDLLTRKPIYKMEDLAYANLAPDTVVHLHGSLHEPTSMVLTTQDYTERYSNDRKGTENRVLTFLELLFSTRNVLFIGYGLEELEILEYVIQKSGQKNKPSKEGAKHFILQGFFTHEQLLANEMEDYFSRECNVQLLPFSKDQGGFRQLLAVIESFAQDSPVQSPLVVQELTDMKGLLDE